MKSVSLILMGLMLVVMAGCGGSDTRIVENTEELMALEQQLQQAQEDRNTAQQQAQKAQEDRDAAQQQARQAQQDRDTAQQQAQQAQEQARQAQQERDTAQQQAQQAQEQARQAQQEEDDAETITRALGLLEALEPEFRADKNDPNPAVSRLHASTVLGNTHPLEAAPRQPRVTNLHTSSVKLTVMNNGEFNSAGGIPSLSMGGASLSSTLLERDDPQNKTQEMAIYTDFKPRRKRLLDVYADFRPDDPDDKSQKLNEISLSNSATSASISAGEKMRERTGNAMMYADVPELLVLQPNLSGVTLPANSYVLSATDYRRGIENELNDNKTPDNTSDDFYDATVTYSFPATLRGVSGRVQTQMTGIFDERLTEAGCKETPAPDVCTAPSGFTINTAPQPGTSRYVPVSYTLGSGDWTFKPNSANSTVWLDDAHYLYFGWWQETPDEADGVYDFHLIAGVGEESRWGGNNYALKEGAAVYTGPATGKYVRTIGAHDELDHAGELRREAEAGIFTADARLEADFTGMGVEGTITNFQDDGQAIPGGWQVLLNRTNLAFATSGWDADGTAVIKQIGQAGPPPTEEQTGQESWRAIFLADEDTQALTNASPAQPSQPASAVGHFDVGLDRVIHFTGAFGVKRTN